MANLSDSYHIGLREGEVGLDRLSPLDEESYGPVLGQLVEQWKLFQVRESQWRHDTLALTGEVLVPGLATIG